MQKNIFIGFIFLFSSWVNAAALPEFNSHIAPVSAQTKILMQKYTWQLHCPVPINNLAEIKVTYFGFDRRAHLGTLIINKKLAAEVVTIFKALYLHRFPINHMDLIETFHGDDEVSMQANNTSAFNCRTVVDRPDVFSVHSYGEAIDINPLINPYVRGDEVLPKAGKKYLNASDDQPGKISKNSFIYFLFKQNGWEWGGDWHDLQDYQHFQKIKF